MKAMILAAGYGRRLKPLTNHTPKPLLPVQGKPLIQHHLERLALAGITDVVINSCWLGEQLEAALADGKQFGLEISWSREQVPLETGGGIKQALPKLGKGYFILISGDVWADYSFAALSRHNPEGKLAHLVLVPNPSFHSDGDFSLNERGEVGLENQEGSMFTYSGIALINSGLFEEFSGNNENFPLRDVLRPAIQAGKVSGEVYRGIWSDVGTLERLNILNKSEH
jgi:MurNAc alpha-1-phosphate uridylyltransferase